MPTCPRAPLLPAGLFQATGWPGVVSVVANWFGKGKRGLIMGVWNAHTSVGNILGTLLAAAALPYGWGWSFILPGALIFVMGVVIYCFLVVEPADVGFKNIEVRAPAAALRACALWLLSP